MRTEYWVKERFVKSRSYVLTIAVRGCCSESGHQQTCKSTYVILPKYPKIHLFLREMLFHEKYNKDKLLTNLNSVKNNFV